MKHLSIGKSGITLLFTMGILVMISTSIVAYLNSQSQEDKSDYIINGYRKINIIEKINSNILDAEGKYRAFEINKDSEYISSIDYIKLNVDSLLKELYAGSSEYPKQKLRIDSLKISINERFELYSKAMIVIYKKNSNPKLLKSLTDRIKIVRSDLNGIVSRFKNDETQIIISKHELGDQSYRFTFYTIAGGTIVCSIIFILIFIYLKRNSKIINAGDDEISREELEKIIRDRTAELSHINNKLNSKLSELQQMESELKNTVNYYKMLFEQAHDAIMIVNPDDEIVLDVNKRACDIYGFSREEFIGLSLRSISKNVQMGEENERKILEKGFYHNFQTVHYNKYFNEMLMEINASVIEYKGKKAILSICRDITERVLLIR